MARAGVLYSQVASVATQLADQGVNATVDNVREALGNTGSKSTIGPLLKRWKNEQEQRTSPTQAGLPTDLVTTVKNLYEQLQHDATKKVDVAFAELALAKESFNEQLNVARDAATTFKTERDALNEALVRERNALEKLGVAHHGLQIVEARMQTEVTSLTQRVQDHRTEIDNLQRQLHQARTQFEHYQESIVEQRMKEQLQFEQGKATLEAEIAEMRRHLATKDMMVTRQDQRIAQLELIDEELQSSKSEYLRLEADFLKATQTLNTQTVLASELSARFDVASEALLDAQNKLAILEHERPLLQARNIDLEAKVTSLEALCHALRIEKAILEGQFKQVAAHDTRSH